MVLVPVHPSDKSLGYCRASLRDFSAASAEIQQRVRDRQEESAIELSNQSKERALVGEVI